MLTTAPDDAAHTNEVVEEAWTHIQTGGDPFGTDYAPIEVTFNQGGN